MVILREAANVKYAQFVDPGQTLTVHAEIVDQQANQARLKTRATVDVKVIVSARLVLAKFNLGDTDPDYRAADRTLRDELRAMYANLYPPIPGGSRGQDYGVARNAAVG